MFFMAHSCSVSNFCGMLQVAAPFGLALPLLLSLALAVVPCGALSALLWTLNGAGVRECVCLYFRVIWHLFALTKKFKV